MTDKIYPGVFVRVKAMVIDGIILLVFMVATSSVFSLFNEVPDVVRVSAFVFIFLLYDPLLPARPARADLQSVCYSKELKIFLAQQQKPKQKNIN